MKKEIGVTEETLFIFYRKYFFFPSELCQAIEVTGDTTNSEEGLYLLSDERASDTPNNPVWKSSEGKQYNRFIFNTGSTAGWRIGKEIGLTDGGYFCKSKHILMIFSIASRFTF